MNEKNNILIVLNIVTIILVMVVTITGILSFDEPIWGEHSNMGIGDLFT